MWKGILSTFKFPYANTDTSIIRHFAQEPPCMETGEKHYTNFEFKLFSYNGNIKNCTLMFLVELLLKCTQMDVLLKNVSVITQTSRLACKNLEFDRNMKPLPIIYFVD